ncbi:MAG TPA: SGNH/GDSL hydrolase family protein [Lentisphaeria bacterium]|nr:SGNH/GDSL hydrolase family protein [Lentisphaeria bacterium]
MKPKAMLIGDSIRMYCQAEITRQLENDFTVWGPEENCRFAKYTAKQLPIWFGVVGTPDIIHWNNGLWDTTHLYAEDGPFTPLEEYLRYLAIVLRELRKRCPKVIFATTTPVVEPHATQKNSVISAYNQAATAFMQAQGVPVNDLYAFVYPQRTTWLCEDGCHPAEAGKAAIGAEVARVIRNCAAS